MLLYIILKEAPLNLDLPFAGCLPITLTSVNLTSEASGDKRIWKASQIARMKPWEFEKVEAELDAARAEGRIDLNS